jgi:creatinine amidohydrolase
MHFPGTVTLRAETVEAILSDLIKSLHEHGLANFLIVNGHGDNGPVLRTMGYRLLVEDGIRIAAVTALALVSDLIKERVGSRHWGHSGEVETSLALYLAPDIVKTESLAAEDLKGVLDEIPVGRHDILFPRYFDELTSNGVWGDARLASREFGKELAEAAVEGIVELGESLLRAQPAKG